MRKILISLAAAASAAAFATPAAAQYYPEPRGYAYGYNSPYNYGQVRSFEARLQQMRNEIQVLRSQGRLNRRDAAILDREARTMIGNLRYVSQNGLDRRETRLFQRGINQLQTTIRREVRAGPGYRRYGY